MDFGEPFGGLIPGARGAVLGVVLRTDTPLTGRQIHALLSDRHSLWSVQQNLKDLTRLGLITSHTIGRSGMHTINEHHVAVAPLRKLLNPIDALADVVREVVGEDAEAVIVFGSLARGEARPDSDVDLAVIAPPEWDGRLVLEDAVRSKLGNDCDVLRLSNADLVGPGPREPVADEIVRDGIALVGTVPRPVRRAAS
jgi:predicted nucleotidyltransferase